MTKNEIIGNIKELLTELVKIDSRLIDNNEENPHGIGVTKAFDLIEERFINNGFVVNRFDNHAVEVVYGEGNKDFVIPVHLDIVPFDLDKWESNPLELTEKNGYYYGRGTTDNKGAAAIMTAVLETLKSEDFKTNQRIKVVFLGDEETTWAGCDYYLKNVDKVAEGGFVPDAEFPLINAEKGVFTGSIKGKLIETMDLNFDVNINSLKAGNVVNAVPGKLEANINFIENHRTQSIKDLLLPQVEYTENEDGSYNIVMEGRPAHGSTPWLGKSVFDKFICIVDSIKFNRSFTTFYEWYKENFYDDIYGKKIGIESFDDYMGPSTINVGMINYDGKGFEISLDIRQTKTISVEDIKESIAKVSGDYDYEIDLKHELLYINEDSEMVKTLLESYKRVTGEKDAKPFAIGGGTYARAFPNTVAFGITFTTKDGRKDPDMHGNSENISIDSIWDTYNIYLDVLKSLKK